MITSLFMMLWFLMTLLFVYLFEAFVLTWMSPLFWLLAVLISFVLNLAWVVLLLVIWPLFQRGEQPHNLRNHHLAHGVMKLVIKLLRVKLHVSGTENIPKTQFVLVGNHQSNYDIIGIKPFIHDQPMVFIAKKQLFSWPVVGPYVKLLGNIPINRMTDRSAIEAIIGGINRYKEGLSLAVFPEGKRSHGNDMIDFKPGAFKLAMKPNAPILVTSIYNFHRIWRGWPFKTTHAYIHFHPVIEPKSYAQKNTQVLAKEVKQIIQDKLDEFAKISPH